MLTPDQITAARQSLGVTVAPASGPGGTPPPTPQSRVAALDQAWGTTPDAATPQTAAPTADPNKTLNPVEAVGGLGDADMNQLKQAGQKIVDSVTQAGHKLDLNTGDKSAMGAVHSVGDVLEGLLGAGSGIVQGITAPVSAVFEQLLKMDPARARPGDVDVSDPTGARMAAAKQFAAAHPELSQNIRDAVMVASALAGGEGGLIPGANTNLGEFASSGKALLEDAAGRVKAGFTGGDEPPGPSGGAAPIAPVKPPLADAVGAPALPAEKPTAANVKTSVVNSGLGHAIGVQPGTIHEIRTNPDLFTTENMAKASRQSLAEEVQGGISKKLATLHMTKEAAAVSPRALADEVSHALSERESALQQSARDYGAVTGERTPGSTQGPNINVAKNFLESQIQKATGRAVKNGVIDTSPNLASSVRDPKDLAALQKFLDTRGPAFKKGTLSGNEFLNLRDDLTGLSHFDKSGAMPSTALEKVGKGIRANLNDTYRGRFKGLEAADAAYEKQVTDLNRLKTGLIDQQGNLSENTITRILNSTGKGQDIVADKLNELVPGLTGKVKQLQEINAEMARLRSGIMDEKGHLLDGAANRIANAGGVGKDLLSSRLEEVAPGIGGKIRFLKAVEDIQGAKGIKTGAYVKAGLMLVNGPFGVAAFILTHPDVAVPLLRKFGASAEEAGKIASDLGLAEDAK